MHSTPKTSVTLTELDRADTEDFLRDEPNVFTGVLFSRSHRRLNRRLSQSSPSSKLREDAKPPQPAPAPNDLLELDFDEKTERRSKTRRALDAVAQSARNAGRTLANPRGAFESVLQFIPILRWLPQYGWRNQLVGDLSGAVTITMLALPQSMAYAQLGELPPVYGLYACVIPMILYGILGTSPHLSVGPVALNSLLYSTMLDHYEVGSPEYNAAAVTLTMFVGFVTMAFGFLRLGHVVKYISPAVMTGFTTAYVILAGIPQLCPIMGYEASKEGGVLPQFYRIIIGVTKTNWITLAFGTVTLLIVLGMKKYKPRWPGAMVAITLTTLVAFLLNRVAPEYTPPVVGFVQDGPPQFAIPSLYTPDLATTLVNAAVLALLGFMQSIAAAKKYSEMYGGDVKPNQELVVLGICAVGGSFFKGFQPTGAFSRTAVGVENGSRTQITSFITAALIVLSLCFITPAFYFIPKAALAAVIIAATLPLVDFSGHVRLWQVKPREGLVALITMVVVMASEVYIGLMVGVAASLLAPIARAARPGVPLLGELPSPRQGIWRELKRFKDARPPTKGIRVVRLDAELSFANVGYLEEVMVRAAEGIYPMEEEDGGVDAEGDAQIEMATIGTTTACHAEEAHNMCNSTTPSTPVGLKEMEEGVPDLTEKPVARKARFLVLDLSASPDVDVAGAAGLVSIAGDLWENHGCTLLLASVKSQVRKTLCKAWTSESAGGHGGHGGGGDTTELKAALMSRFFADINKAVLYAERAIRRARSQTRKATVDSQKTVASLASSSVESPDEKAPISEQPLSSN